MMCRLLPSLPRSVGLGPVSWPPGAGHARTVDACAPPIDLVMFAQAAQHGQMQLLPHARRLTIA
ncbi:hypothetical protein WJ41_01620 [Burkholderia ubonensis]|nr:hypothetical protein WJ41_01620 [Burkholderia ubonensis]KVU43862.1 hypothetical protein WK66_20230 [Burkholderia ubonensis]